MELGNRGSGPVKGPLFLLLHTPDKEDQTPELGLEARLSREEGPARVVAELIDPVLSDMGYRLVRVRITGESGQTLQIMAERPDGTMTIDDCEAVSRVISPLLDVEDPISGEYVLEVSSPGIDRPLVRLSDFERWAGYVAKVELTRMVDGRRRFRGTLKGITGSSVSVLVEDASEKVEVVVPFEDIAEAKLVMTDELFRLALKRQDEQGEEYLG
ncbi:ribosome maturation factor RimP [Rhodoligotrophos appendicifer]|uniref:ribosome maturation factor RimP n=1 Tax=Rhodoligotrophos appendicifer TaxID=987056 RepID=UPI003D16FFF1